MQNDIDIKSLWNDRKVPAGDLSLVCGKIKRFKRRRIMEAIIIIVLMISVIALGLIIGICLKSQFVTTKAGIALLTVGFILPILSYSRLLYLYHGLQEDRSCMDYINNLLSIKKHEKKQQHIVLNLYFLILSFGLGLYIYEYTFSRSFYVGLLSYTVLLLWIALNWFVFRPRIIKKRSRKLADYMRFIERYQKMSEK